MYNLAYFFHTLHFTLLFKWVKINISNTICKKKEPKRRVQITTLQLAAGRIAWIDWPLPFPALSLHSHYLATMYYI